jgi:hypothetical protein
VGDQVFSPVFSQHAEASSIAGIRSATLRLGTTAGHWVHHPGQQQRYLLRRPG